MINGVTISTGCWPEHHGIVSNLFFDPERGHYDHASDSDWLVGCEHMHQAAERQGVASAALGWYGRFSETQGAQASVTPASEQYFANFPDDAGRLAQVVELLNQAPGKRPRLILAYFKGPDGAGHFAGMEAAATREAVTAADAAVGTVLDAIDAQADASQIQLLVTTDHGMVPVEQLVNMRRILRRHDIDARAISSGTSSFLYFDDPSEANISSALQKLASYGEFDVHRRSAQPDSWHIGAGPRVGDLIVSASPPYFIEDPESWPWYIRWLAYIGPDFLPSEATIKATHGYPTDTPGVEGILYARGSAFAPGRNVERVRAIDIHPTVMHVLGLEPGRPVDGTVQRALLR
jgi:alkaline phosphatase D